MQYLFNAPLNSLRPLKAIDILFTDFPDPDFDRFPHK